MINISLYLHINYVSVFVRDHVELYIIALAIVLGKIENTYKCLQFTYGLWHMNVAFPYISYMIISYYLLIYTTIMYH